VLCPRAENNASAGFLAQVDFLTPKVFRSSAAAELVAFALSKYSSNSFADIGQ